MTDDLVKRLRKHVFYGDARLFNMKKHSPLAMEAAHTIEAQAAEIEKLEALFTNATYEARAMMEEIERLRAELNGWREMAGKAEQ